MDPSKRVKGNRLSLQIGTPAVDYKCETSSVVLDNEEADDDFVTFCDAEGGGARQFFLEITAAQTMVKDSLWREVWDRTGEEVPFTLAPYGNETPSADQPHIIGTAKIGPPPTLGGEAGVNVTQTFETRWDVVGKPVLDDGTAP